MESDAYGQGLLGVGKQLIQIPKYRIRGFKVGMKLVNPGVRNTCWGI